MALRWTLRPNAYHDSVKLMRVSEMLASEPRVQRAAAVMATPLNLELLEADALLPPGVNATPEDLLVAILAEEEADAERALAQLETFLAPVAASSRALAARSPSTVEEAAVREGANLAVIAVPGPYASAEAFAALRAGMHVFLFSDNVPVEDEVALKRLAEECDLLMMGPDCGTAIIDGVGLGFANRVMRGPVGIVGASGTGIQQLCCLLDDAAIGIAQALGTGGRDLSAHVGGTMTRRALRILESDPEVEIIAVISKPADAEAAAALRDDLEQVSKPAVVCLLGTTFPDTEGVHYTANLTEMAATIVRAVSPDTPFGWSAQHRPVDRSRSGQVYGLFTGGTLCTEAAGVLQTMAIPHTLVDLGDDEFTRGRAHPIIDPRLRLAMLAELTEREDVGVVLLDVILGDLAHPDPAGALRPALERLAPTPVLATLVGTRADPQGLERQRATLRDAGPHVQVFASNVAAATVAGTMLKVVA